MKKNDPPELLQTQCRVSVFENLTLKLEAGSLEGCPWENGIDVEFTIERVGLSIEPAFHCHPNEIEKIFVAN